MRLAYSPFIRAPARLHWSIVYRILQINNTDNAWRGCSRAVLFFNKEQLGARRPQRKIPDIKANWNKLRVRTPLSHKNSRSFPVYSRSFITFFQEFLYYLRRFKNSKSNNYPLESTILVYTKVPKFPHTHTPKYRLICELQSYLDFCSVDELVWLSTDENILILRI